MRRSRALAHGWAKLTRGPEHFAKLLGQAGVPQPAIAVWSVTALELLGGLAIFVGAFVALVSIPLTCSMIGAMLTVQFRYGFSSVNTIGLTRSGPVFGAPGYEINLLYIAGLLALAFAGSDTLSVDNWRLSRHGRVAARG